ncbi:hypothetical protein [Limimaricola pyoseonensis]|uniref:Uncharacterized protein n=1 Tax=Limimaricola pyoseonensis TaxID=521013 RepID=A0A1G7IIJ2_9RHOB|nr:hypothetical protein [Limimaricola pyoseonensis]SDF12354.1 hypothetical protein SAMN04488567_3476 [Limimaricola pyoseonensis]
MLIRSAVLASLLALVPALVAADEMWVSETGPVIYESEIDDMALLSFMAPEGAGMLYIHDLAGNYEDRGVHARFWIADEPGACAATLTGPDGRSSRNFGRLTVAFDRPGWPSGFTAVLYPCMDDYGVPHQLRASLE